ncbi:hypothetical protein AXA44_08970 [Rhodococcus sp. SC4]|nr:hypothetical protein AXA44_08970 [Rhodococcus sp. SC4]KXX58054.1 hypothetical protein AZG88_46895 [Rhodococcus sp. LB1]
MDHLVDMRAGDLVQVMSQQGGERRIDVEQALLVGVSIGIGLRANRNRYLSPFSAPPSAGAGVPDVRAPHLSVAGSARAATAGQVRHQGRTGPVPGRAGAGAVPARTSWRRQAMHVRVDAPKGGRRAAGRHRYQLIGDAR